MMEMESRRQWLTKWRARASLMDNLYTSNWTRRKSLAPEHKRASMWWCRCDCGTEIRILGIKLKNGHTKSVLTLDILKQIFVGFVSVLII